MLSEMCLLFTIHLVGFLHTAEAVSLPWVSNMLFSGSTVVRLNEADLALSDSVTVGAYAAVTECSKQFKYERWNCPTTAFLIRPGSSPPSIGGSPAASATNGDDSLLNREAALVRAFTSAGITFTLTKNCSAGDFANCLCDSRYSRKKSSFEWGGCSDNYQFGSLVARQFLDSQESGADPVSLVNLHNNAAGRVAVKKTMRRMCKCHGVSGSCATQTCWRQISDFKTVGQYLKKGYKKALKVDFADGSLVESGVVANKVKRNGRRTRDGNRRARSSDRAASKLSLLSRAAAGNNAPDNRSNFIGGRSSNRRRRARRQRNRKDRTSRNFKAFKDGSANRRVMQREAALPDVRWRHSAPPEDEPEANKNKVKKRHIVFLKDSPDYCHASSWSKGVSMGAGHQGVLGRKCSADPNSPNPKAGIKKCAKLCRSCGLQPRKEVVEVLTTCECRFKWCCDVQCKTCQRKKVEITCVEP